MTLRTEMGRFRVSSGRPNPSAFRRSNGANCIGRFNLKDYGLAYREMFVCCVGTEVTGLHILTQDDRADILCHQDAAVDVGLDDAASAEPFQMLDLEELCSGVTTKQIVI